MKALRFAKLVGLCFIAIVAGCAAAGLTGCTLPSGGEGSSAPEIEACTCSAGFTSVPLPAGNGSPRGAATACACVPDCAVVADPSGICAPTNLVVCGADAGPPMPLGNGCANAYDYGPGAYCCTPEKVGP